MPRPDLSFRTTRRAFIAGAASAGAALTIDMPAVHVRANSVAIPDGYAIVTSPRLPLFDIGSDDAGQLLAGAIPDWREVGSPIGLPVELLASGQAPPGITAAQTYPDFASLATAFTQHPGGVALVPVDQVDFRANILAVDGFDPVRHANGGEPVVTIGFVGDIVPGRNVDNKMRQFGDYTHPFQRIASTLTQFDVTIANLEGNLSSTKEPPTDPHTFTFVSSPRMVDGFKLAGIDAVSLANNHSTWNSEGWGTSGLTDTIDALNAGGVPYFGAGLSLDEARKPVEFQVAGKRIAIIGIDGVTANKHDLPGIVYGSNFGGDGLYAGAGVDSPGTSPFDADLFIPDIQNLAGQYDIVIPYFHFGVEYIAVPPQWAVDAARSALDAGATMVVTNHPHLIQGMETHNGKPIFYSVGNFIFDQMFSAQVREGFVLEIAIRGGRVVGLRPRGVEIEDFNQPRLMTAGEHASLMDRFWDATARIAASR